jgi:hypothetical protein
MEVADVTPSPVVETVAARLLPMTPPVGRLEMVGV